MKKLWPWFTGIIIISGVFIIVNTAGDTKETLNTFDTDHAKISGPQGNCAVSLPDQIDFAGEQVPIKEWDIAEHLDRELLINTYWHSSSLRIIKLANRWFPIITQILKENNIPGDFKYLAVAESGLQNIVSPAGAGGFWQFMPKTAKQYGLQISSEIDQRYDVVASTKAACKYLNDAYQKLHSWTLAAAAYNMGSSRLIQSIEQQQISNYYNLYLNKETARYMYRILAFKLILSDPTRYGFCFNESDLYQPVPYQNYFLSEPIDNLAKFAIEQHTNLKMLKLLNPWMKGNKLSPAEGDTITIALPL